MAAYVQRMGSIPKRRTWEPGKLRFIPRRNNDRATAGLRAETALSAVRTPRFRLVSKHLLPHESFGLPRGMDGFSDGHKDALQEV